MEIGRLYKETGRTSNSKLYFEYALKYFKKIKALHEIEIIKNDLLSLS